MKVTRSTKPLVVRKRPKLACHSARAGGHDPRLRCWHCWLCARHCQCLEPDIRNIKRQGPKVSKKKKVAEGELFPSFDAWLVRGSRSDG